MEVERDQAQPGRERFRALGSRVIGTIGLLIVAVVLLFGVIDSDADYHGWAWFALAFAGVLIWAALLRPAVWIQGDLLVLRNMLDTVFVPLAGIEQVSVRQFVAVRIGDKRYVGSGVSRTALQSMRDDRKPDDSLDRSYGAWVEYRIAELAERARRARGIGLMSEEQAALQADVRRDWAWPEIGLLAGLGLALVVALFL